MHTLTVTLADLEGVTHGTTAARTSVEVSARYSREVVLTDGTIIPPVIKRAAIPGDGVASFEVYESDSPEVDPNYRGFLIVVEATVTPAHCGDDTYRRSVSVSTASPDPVALGSLPSVAGSPAPSWQVVTDARLDALEAGGGGGGAVSSVNGQTGAVSLDADDVGALPDTYTPPAQSWSQITGKPSTFAPTIGTTATTAMAGNTPIPATPGDIGAATSTQGALADTAVQPADLDPYATDADLTTGLSGKADTGHNHDTRYVRTVNGTGPDGAGNVTVAGGGGGEVSSVNGQTGAVVLDAADVSALPDTYTPPAQSWSQITGKPATFAPATHTHAVADVTGLQTALDSAAAPQTLSLAGSDLSLSGGGGSVTLPAGGTGGAVDSVNGQTGSVVLDAADVGAATVAQVATSQQSGTVMRAAVAAGEVGVLVLGDSKAVGIGLTDYADRWQNRLAALMRTRFPIAGGDTMRGLIPANMSDPYNAMSGRPTTTGTTFPVDTAGLGYNTLQLELGSVLTFPAATWPTASTLPIGYHTHSGANGTLEVLIDGVVQTEINCAGTGEGEPMRTSVPISAGTHTVTMRPKTGTAPVRPMYIEQRSSATGWHLYDAARAGLAARHVIDRQGAPQGGASFAAAVAGLPSVHLAIVALGTNDMTISAPAQYGSDVRAVVDMVKAGHPTAGVVVVLPAALTDDSAVVDDVQAYHTAARSALVGVPDLSILAETQLIDTTGPNASAWLADSVHPNAFGHDVISRALAGSLVGLDGQQGDPGVGNPQTLSLVGSDLTLSDGGGTVTLPSGGGGATPLLTRSLSGLPGRPLSATQQTIQITTAALSIGSIFEVVDSRTLTGVIGSVATAATAGSVAYVGVYTYDLPTGDASLHANLGTVAIDVSNQQFSITSSVTLPAGVYCAVIIPGAAVTLRALRVHDALLGFQQSQEFNGGANRVFAFPAKTVAAGSLPASITSMQGITSNGGIQSSSLSWCALRF